MSLENYFKKLIKTVATEVVNQERTLENKIPETSMAKVIDFNTETGKLKLKLSDGTIVDNVSSGSGPVGPNTCGLYAGKKFIT